jgi:predicted AAA+ superfamily ATPase
MIYRTLKGKIEARLRDNKIIILLGARQTGKTTLLRKFFTSPETLWLNGDDFDTRNRFKSPNSTSLINLIGDKQRLIIDEAQRIENIGLVLKILHDSKPELKIIATGSSSFELANQINEPLTGRKWEFILWPISLLEYAETNSVLETTRLIKERMIYGWYPDVINYPGDEIPILNELADSYLYKDILTWENIKKPQKLEALVQALALQIGSQVSFNEIGQLIGINNETVERYVNLLEKAFIIFRLPSLSRNLRNELKKSRKIYFYDLGIRNAVIKNFNTLELRNDVGALWENFLIVERLKYKSNNRIFSNNYFWRTHAQQEIDFIEEYNGIIHAYEFKWNPRSRGRISSTFKNAYPNHTSMIISQDNFWEFVRKN